MWSLLGVSGSPNPRLKNITSCGHLGKHNKCRLLGSAVELLKWLDEGHLVY